jgi:hypothetical protein
MFGGGCLEQGVPQRAATLLLAVATTAARGQDADALAKKLSNPVSDLVSVPLQLNYDHGFGSQDEGARWQLNVQPVVPFSLSSRWNLISRTIVPLVDQDGPLANGDRLSGLGDISQSFFFSPTTPTASGWLLGAGPIFRLPTATNDRLGGEHWGAGPTIVAVRQTTSGWTYGALVDHVWSFGGNPERPDTSDTFFQPFLAKQLGQGRTLTISAESSYSWDAHQWTVPLNVLFSRVSHLGSQPLSYQFGVRAFLETPDGGPDWGLRFNVTLLYPRR